MLVETDTGYVGYWEKGESHGNRGTSENKVTRDATGQSQGSLQEDSEFNSSPSPHITFSASPGCIHPNANAVP